MSDIPDSLNKKVVRALHDQGMEMTPDEVTDARKEAFATIQAKMREKGYHVPDGDLELLEWMKEVGL